MTDQMTTDTTVAATRLPGEAHAILQMASLSQIAADGPLVIARSKGNRLWDIDGREYIDAINGLFNVNIGYGRPELPDIAADAMRRLSFGSNFFGRTTAEALELCEKLAAITPDGLNRFFLTVGGSDAIDTAIKLTRHANVLAGLSNKMTVIARRDGYHGMTMGGTTATGVKVFRESVGPLLPGVVHIGQPGPAGDNATAEQLEAKILDLGPENVAAFLGEPMSLPPGVAIPPDDYWPAIREVCSRYDVRLIADEVINGFGRTGLMFASDHWSINPDLMTMSKGITSGYLPLGAVGMREEHYQQLLASETVMPHGFTAGGHPVACAVALANIAIIEDEGLVENAATVGEYLNKQLDDFAGRHEMVLSTRSLGMVAAFDIDGEEVTGDPETAAKAGVIVASEMTNDGVLLRPYGNTMAFGPSLATTREEIDEIFERFDGTITRLRR
jgi:putrescine---pyruvate transaminase